LGDVGSTVHPTATLTSNGVPLEGKSVTFSVGEDQAVGVTNASGVATAGVLLNSVPGNGYLLSASFVGDSTLLGSGDSHPFTIGKVDTSITLTGPASPIVIGTSGNLVATLKTGTTPIPFKTVWFVVTGTNPSTTAVLTGTDGKATFGTGAMLGGTYSITACFDKPTPQNGCPVTTALDDSYTGSASAAISLRVTWPFTGFSQPVDNPGTSGVLNTVNAGSSVPVKFSLGGDRGLNILAANSPIVTTISCLSSAPTDDIETTVSTSGLQYDASTGQYTYVWKTVKGQTGCRQLNVKLVDGSDHIALFKFK
jgi:hypothetical protein